MLRKVEVTVEVTFNDDDVFDLEGLMKKIIEVGQADAVKSANDPEFPDDDAYFASEIQIGKVYVKNTVGMEEE